MVLREKREGGRKGEGEKGGGREGGRGEGREGLMTRARLQKPRVCLYFSKKKLKSNKSEQVKIRQEKYEYNYKKICDKDKHQLTQNKRRKSFKQTVLLYF